MSGKSVELNLDTQPLSKSIQTPSILGLARAPQRHIVTTAETGEEVNAWDLAHSLISNGQSLGFAGGAPEFAEPDLEQQCVFGTEPQHALALVRSCDKADSPEANLPVGTGR
jgi:hypothetical protein